MATYILLIPVGNIDSFEAQRELQGNTFKDLSELKDTVHNRNQYGVLFYKVDSFCAKSNIQTLEDLTDFFICSVEITHPHI